tara:strand:- start:15 stop:665 length:651 start_codon:yes stop_codon:yes gene_type:complete
LGAGDDVALINGSGSIITVGEGKDTLILAVDARDLEIKGFQGPTKGVSSVTKVIGSSGGDELSGNDETTDLILAGSGDDLIYGFDSEDILLGQEGNDTVFGGNGNDFIFSGAGNDKLDGGEGEDGFVFDLAKMKDGNVHQIEDFDPNSDSIYLLSTGFDEKPVVSKSGNNTLISYKGKKVVEVTDVSPDSIKAEDILLTTSDSFLDIEEAIHFDIV